MNEYEYEPIRGLPEELPPGERILWQGEPRWSGLALRVFRIRLLALYFAALLAVHSGNQWLQGIPWQTLLEGAAWQLALGATALGILSLLAWLYARSTVFTLTNRRIVLRFGVAVPMMINLPLEQLEAAALRTCSDGTGDIALTLRPGQRVSYWALWPFARPWHWSRVRPMLRAVASPQDVAERLCRAATHAPAPQPGAETVSALDGLAAAGS